MSTQPSTSEDQYFYDEKQRKIIPKDSLVCVPESTSQTEHIVRTQDDSWSQHSWHMAGHVPNRPGKGKKSWRRQPQPKQVNKLQRKLDEALAKPVQISKAESMMQKMGWQGGALGKTGTGIVEPVAPNAAYAIKTRGFGQATYTPPKKKKPVASNEQKKEDLITFQKSRDPLPQRKKRAIPVNKHKKKKLEPFHTKALQQILEFVKNDYESEIVFDKQLFKNERKQIHHLVNEVINENNLALLGSLALMDVVEEIRSHNNYVLCTESQGTYPDRYLCLFKEAPEHVYLITPADLRENSKDIDESDVKHEEKDQHSKSQDSTNKDSNDLNNPNNLVKEIPNLDKTLDSSSIGSIEASEKEEFNHPGSTSKPVKETATLKNYVNTKFKDATALNASLDDVKFTNENVNDAINNEPNKERSNIGDHINTESKDNNSLKDLIEESANMNKNLKEELVDNNDSNSKENKESNQIIDVTAKLIEYLKEFSECEDYTEMRFLGPFTWEEMDRINNLVSNIYYHVNHNEDKVDKLYEEALKELDEERFLFEVKEDINGSPVIHKTDRHPGEQRSTENHIFFDSEEM